MNCHYKLFHIGNNRKTDKASSFRPGIFKPWPKDIDGSKLSDIKNHNIIIIHGDIKSPNII